MIKKIFIILIILINTSCSLKNVVKHHGVHFLEKKQTKLKILETNTNDTKKILGHPSTKNTFDNDVWIYIERKTTVSKIRTLGRKKLLVNNVLVLEFNNKGLLVKKDFYNVDNMNEIKIAKDQSLPVRLVSSAQNLDSFSLYTRQGFTPIQTFQDLYL